MMTNQTTRMTMKTTASKVVLVISFAIIICWVVFVIIAVIRYHPTVKEKLIQNIQYYQDTRTGLCFAVSEASGAGSSALATVPCDKVKDHLSQVGDVQ